MEKPVCITCQSAAKQGLACGLCAESICKSCTQFIDDGQFSFLPELPKDLAHNVYCGVCYDKTVAPALAEYEHQIEKAKQILIYEKHQGKESRLLSRKESPVSVQGCEDRSEALLRLAFLAVLKGYNGLVDVQLVPTKLKQNSRPTTIWNGSGVPTDIRSERLIKDRSFWQNPN